MTAPDTLPERAAVPGAHFFLPLNLCRAASLNPRRRFKKEALDELADSIEKLSVLQPVLARPIADAKRGDVLYEIIAGERRFRACQLVAKRNKQENVAVIPAIVRDLTDFEALELATTENLQREDLHPLEEAEGFEGLLLHPISGGEFNPPRMHGYTVDQLAARIGKGKGYVFASLKLLALIPPAREAFYADKISKSVAILLARMPASVQVQATKRVVEGWGGEPFAFRQAQEMLQREFMLKLGSAPFKITDETLVPGAGNCRECPKRTGANPGLFDDIGSADVCTDPACFAQKKDAHQARLIAQAKDEGREVILGSAAKKVKPSEYDPALKGYLRVDAVHHAIDGSKSIEKLLGKDAPPIALLEDPHTHDLIRVVRTDAAMQVLKDKGVVKSSRAPSGNAAERAAEQKAKAETAWRTAVAERTVAAAVDPKYDDLDLHSWLLPEIAVAMWMRLDHDTTKRAAKLLGWADGIAAEATIRELQPAELDQALIAMALAGELHVNQYSIGGKKPARLLDIAGRLGVDGAKVRAELNAAAKAKASTKKPAPSAAKKSTKAKAGAGVAYRDPATGATWSGRGLKPKWLVVALTAGKKLADFATAAAPSKPGFQSAAADSGRGVEKSESIETTSAAAEPSKSEETKLAAAKAAGKPKTEQNDKAPAIAGAARITPAGAWPFPIVGSGATA